MGHLSVTSDEISSAPKNLSDMPIDVAGLIIERSDYKEQLVLRKVSKSLRALVDKLKPACTSIQVGLYYSVRIYFDNQLVMYTNHVNNFKINDGDVKTMKDDFKKAAFDDLASTFKNPKLQLENLMIAANLFETKDIDECYHNIRRVFESLNHQVSVKEIEFRRTSPPSLFSILPYLKPGFLEKISLSFDREEVDWTIDSIGIDQVALLEQWKQAKELEWEHSFDEFPMKHATHFKRFKFHERRIYREKFIRIRDYLSKLDNFEYCDMSVLDFFGSQELVYELLGAPVSSNAMEDVFHQPIPDSEYYLEFKKETRSIVLEITKKKREIHC